MISYPKALEALLLLARPRILPAEKVSLESAFGRILSDDVFSKEALPAFDLSAVDGFAVRSRECTEPRTSLSVGMRIRAGDRPSDFKEPPASTSVEIMTGAPLPAGFDAAVKVEDVKRDAGGMRVEIPGPVKPGAFVRLRGSDSLPGDRILSTGMRIDETRIMALAASGIREVLVKRRPRVALLSTGNELVDATALNLAPGEVRNATAPYLIEALGSLGCETRFLGTVRDEEVGESLHFRKILEETLADPPDLLLTTGAVSMGSHDFVKEEVVRAGGRVVFHKAAIKPGKPVLVASFDQAPRMLFIGIPGNPVSSAAVFEFLIQPYLRALLGTGSAPSLQARLQAAVVKPAELRCFHRGEWTFHPDGFLEARIFEGQDSHLIRALARATAWVVLPEGRGRLEAGERVEIVPFFERSGEGLA